MMIATIVAANAQSSQIATLFHDGEITNFTSGTALADALEAAVDGDVISLSSGIFQGADIKKNVTVRGAGMGYPELGGTPATTVLTGNFKIETPDSDSHSLMMEGIVHNETIIIKVIRNATFLKCQLGSIVSDYTTEKWDNLRIIHCVISKLRGPSELSAQFVNSVITKECYLAGMSGTKSFQFENCVVYAGSSVSNTSMRNSIVVLEKGSAYRTEVSASSSISHSIVVGCEQYNAFNGDNKFYSKSEIELFAPEGLYNLSDAIKDFVGSDGTQVGIHGGSLPFSPVTTGLKICKFKVAERTTSDGKLPIEIEIESN